MSPTSNLAPGFTSVESAVELINSDSREKPVVDMDYLIAHKHWIEVKHNFRIPRVRRLGPNEIYKTKRGKIVEYETTGEVNVSIETPFQRELLKKTIEDKYRELVGHEYREKTTRAISTVADDAEGKQAVQPRANKPIAKEGASIGGGEISTSNGDFAV